MVTNIQDSVGRFSANEDKTNPDIHLERTRQLLESSISGMCEIWGSHGIEYQDYVVLQMSANISEKTAGPILEQKSHPSTVKLMQHVPLKCWYLSMKLDGITSQKTTIPILQRQNRQFKVMAFLEPCSPILL
jgi:hypothetical protein